MSWKERERDMMSRRRSRLSGEDRRAFDAHYGKPKATRSKTGAGKGDAPRPVDPDLYELGYLAAYGETEEIRRWAAEEWKKMRGQ